MLHSFRGIPSYCFRSFKEISSNSKFRSSCFGDNTDIEGFERSIQDLKLNLIEI